MSVRAWMLFLALVATVWLSLTAPEEVDADVTQAVVREAVQPGEVDRAANKRAAAPSKLSPLLPRPEPYQSVDAALAAELAEKEPPIFHAQSWSPPPSKALTKVEPPKAPPWPYVYLGQQSFEGQWWVYLTLGEDTRVVKKGQVLDVNYRIDRIEPPLLSVTYLPLNEVQTVTIGAFK